MTPHIYPVARYERATDAITWLCSALGFEEQAVYPGPGDTVAHAELRFGSGTIGLSSAGPVDPTNVWTTVREGVYVCIPDADAHHARALAAKAIVERALQDTSYGSREYTARDHDGHLWSFGTYGMSAVDGPPVFYPALRYRSGKDAVAFLTRAFSLEAGLQVAGGDGDVHHAELWLEGGVMMIAAGAEAERRWQGRKQCTNVYVADPDAHHARAAAAGAHIVRALEDSSYGSRGYLVQDLEGFLWSFSNYRPTRPGITAAAGHEARD